jgi:hypothetical protein
VTFSEWISIRKDKHTIGPGFQDEVQDTAWRLWSLKRPKILDKLIEEYLCHWERWAKIEAEKDQGEQ